MAERRRGRPQLARDFWLVVITGLVLLALWNQRSTTHEVRTNQRANTRALCAYRGDLQRRADQTAAFLQAHPHGAFEIPASTLKVSLINEQSALTALDPLMC